MVEFVWKFPIYYFPATTFVTRRDIDFTWKSIIYFQMTKRLYINNRFQKNVTDGNVLSSVTFCSLTTYTSLFQNFKIRDCPITKAAAIFEANIIIQNKCSVLDFISIILDNSWIENEDEYSFIFSRMRPKEIN